MPCFLFTGKKCQDLEVNGAILANAFKFDLVFNAQMLDCSFDQLAHSAILPPSVRQMSFMFVCQSACWCVRNFAIMSSLQHLQKTRASTYIYVIPRSHFPQ